ncbi:MAG: hypothetical protein QM811_25140 [Pirellulales bacterium]
MKIQTFLEHHGIASNPFAEEDARTDPVFKDHCIDSAYHPAWDKVYGDPRNPATAIVFGEKGAGKTALRLQIVRHLREHDRAHPDAKLYTIEYDDFNPFLDRFRDKLGARRRKTTDRVLAEWKLWDHMDAILTLGVTRLVDRILANEEPERAAKIENDGAARKPSALPFDRFQARDLLLLSACYDQSTAETARSRWQRLAKRLKFRTWRSYWDLALGWIVTFATLALFITLGVNDTWEWFAQPWPYLLIAAGWTPRVWKIVRWWREARAIAANVRISNLQTKPLRQILQQFQTAEISGQPLPDKERTDDRYELLIKFQGLLKALGYAGIIVLVDRVDEPHQINGNADQMRALLWPMLDNKFLQHPGLGFKLLLPIELVRFIEREDKTFYERSRLDKQNMIPSLVWTGEALYDVANARLKACAAPGKTIGLRDLLSESIGERQLLDALRSLRVPRHLFKFLYRMLVAHCGAYTDETPSWRVSPEMFESQLALYRRDQENFDRGLGAV